MWPSAREREREVRERERENYNAISARPMERMCKTVFFVSTIECVKRAELYCLVEEGIEKK